VNDRELLTFAAKAAGIRAVRDPHGALRNCTWFEDISNIFAAPLWNPLTDDGDALRLQVKLKLGVYVCDGVVVAETSMDSEDAVELLRDDPYAATRLAIVRAAAAIGKAMP